MLPYVLNIEGKFRLHSDYFVASAVSSLPFHPYQAHGISMLSKR